MSNIIKKSAGTAIPEADSKEIQPQNTISEIQLKEFITIREQFMPLYSVTGLISIEGSSGIHLNENFFLATFPDYESKPFTGGTWEEELFATFNGVRFFCIK
jgi:hypothetical protein